MDFKTQFKTWQDDVNKALDQYIPLNQRHEKKLYEAMRYSLMAGGKRLRPVLCLAVSDLLALDMQCVMPFGCALEMIHTYSLIHDDLPAMDNDDYRRGMLTSHRVYGEAMAILAGDALLNKAFEVMISYTREKDIDVKYYLEAMSQVSEAAGSLGMIGGQVIDLASEGKIISEDVLRYMHKLKTGALIKASVMVPVRISQVNNQQRDSLEAFADNIGLAFQVRDDILDVEGNLEVMGKSTGSDEAKKKSTFVTLYGVEKSKKLLSEITEKAIESLADFGDRAIFLKDLSYYLVKREN